MVIFHSYLSLPEGIWLGIPTIPGNTVKRRHQLWEVQRRIQWRLFDITWGQSLIPKRDTTGNSMGIRWEFYGDIWLVGGAMCPSWKMMEFVNGKDDIPRLCQKNEMDFFKASHVPNHQMGTCWSPGWWNLGITWGITQAIFENWILGEHLHREPMGHGFSKPVHWALKKVGQLISDEHLQLILW